MTDTIYSIEEIKNVVAPIAQKYDVERVYLFGSYARGEANSTSNLDFIIDKGKLRGLMMAGMLGDLQENFSKNVDLITSSSIAQNSCLSFNQNIEKELVVIYEQ
jgi:predicted nucleotidyltransferase